MILILRIMKLLGREEGQVGSAGVAAALIPTAVLGTRATVGDVLPATGVAIGLYVTLALACITAGLLMRWQAARIERRSR